VKEKQFTAEHAENAEKSESLKKERNKMLNFFCRCSFSFLLSYFDSAISAVQFF